MKDNKLIQQRVDSLTTLTYENSDWPTLINQVLKNAKALGATDAEISASSSMGFTTAVRLREVETIEFTRSKAAVITVYFGKQKGSASTTDTSYEALNAAVKAACEIAKASGKDEYAGLAKKEQLAFHYSPLDLYHSWTVTPEQAIEIALECEEAALSYDPRIINSEGAALSTHQHHYVYANTLDFYGHYDSTQHSLSCCVIGQQGEEMQRDHSVTMARSAQNLKNANFIGKEVAEKTLKRLGARKLNTQKAPIIFEKTIASSLLSSFIQAIRGGNLYRKSSFLLDHLGKKVFPDFIDIYEEPHLIGGLGSAPFDNEGVSTRNKYFIQQGILENYLLNSYSARKLGLETTGNAGGVYNLSIKTSSDNLSSLLKTMDTGLLVTELMGQGINLVTGDYSRGASGFWVEKGEIQFPVEEITIAGNLGDMFKNIVKVANDIEKQRNIITGSLLIEEMMIAGN
ncbi:MAG: Metalloprotease PmbA [Legionellaceae bacterium]